jgi:hypothetical protein
MFHQMLDGIKREVIGVLSRVQGRAESDVEAVERITPPDRPSRIQP